MAFLTIGKLFGMTSPFILKWVVNKMMTSPSGIATGAAAIPMTMAMAPIALTTSIGAVGLWGLSKVISITLLCY